ncbi:MAG: hypothetical protein QOK37_3063 [Thermoanaerobaculia bacterium]|jgi:prevent-host-death family protein|nr:hypothetical protein [Thermoanaerobaculia bacterium]
MIQVNIGEAKVQFLRLLAKVEEGEEVIIARRGKPVAKIVAIKKKPAKNRVLGQDRGDVVIADDFDAPVDPETWR